MKRFTQLVALLVTVLFATQSALAQAPCFMDLQSASEPTSSCCLRNVVPAAHLFHSACHESMQSESTEAECQPTGCQMATVQTAVQAIPTIKFRAEKSSAIIAGPATPTISALSVAMWTVENYPSIGPAKYLLFQVFRI